MKIYHDLPGKAFFSIDLELSVLNMFQSRWHWYAGIVLHWWALSAPVSSEKQNPEQTASQRETEWNSSCSLELKDLVESQTQTYSFNCASLFMLQLSQAMKCLLKTCSALNPSSPWQSWRVQTSSAQMHFSCADFGSLCNSLPILEYLAYQWHPLFASDHFGKAAQVQVLPLMMTRKELKWRLPRRWSCSTPSKHHSFFALCPFLSFSCFSAPFASYARLLSLFPLFSLLWWWGWWTGFILST